MIGFLEGMLWATSVVCDNRELVIYEHGSSVAMTRLPFRQVAVTAK